MSLFSKRLMKWREPKVKGMLTSINFLTALGLVLIISIPFGFLGGNGKFNLWICFFALGFMSIGLIVLVVQSISPSPQIQLRENAIVRIMPKRNEKSAYDDIECIHFYRDCSASLVNNIIVINVHEKSVEGPNFTRFQVAMKNKGVLSNAFANPVTYFGVPDDVNVEQILQILRDKGVNVIEGQLSS
jgi:hypothetical protein